MSHSKEINETSIRQLQITHVELKLYSDACSEPTGTLTDLPEKHSIFSKRNIVALNTEIHKLVPRSDKLMRFSSA